MQTNYFCLVSVGIKENEQTTKRAKLGLLFNTILMQSYITTLKTVFIANKFSKNGTWNDLHVSKILYEHPGFIA